MTAVPFARVPHGGLARTARYQSSQAPPAQHEGIKGGACRLQESQVRRAAQSGWYVHRLADSDVVVEYPNWQVRPLQRVLDRGVGERHE